MRLGRTVSERFESNEPDWAQEATWTDEQVWRRLSRLAQIPAQAAAQVGDLCIGMVRVIATGGSTDARKQLEDGGNIVSDLFFNALRVINPDAEVRGESNHKPPLRLLSARVKELDIASLTDEGNSVVRRHILSRLSYLGRGILLVVTRIIDLVAGLFAAVCAILTGGADEKINSRAYEGLKGPRLAGDLLETLLFVINPNWANSAQP